MAKIDYVVCTKNSERYLETCLNSILQHGEVNNLIIVDEHSTDRTLEIAYHKYDAKIYQVPNGSGIGYSRYIGAQFATTNYVCFVDSDVELTSEWPKVLDSDYPVTSGWYERPPYELPHWMSNGASGWIGCSKVLRSLVLDCKDLQTWKFGEDSKFARWLSTARGMNGIRGIPWYIVDAEAIHHHDKDDVKRWERYGAVLRDIDGLTLSNIIRIVGGILINNKMGSAQNFIENVRIRYHYLKGYLF